MIDIPQRAKNEKEFPQLKKLDKQIIAYKVLMGVSNQDAFRLFHPEYLDGNGRLNAAGVQDCKFFFNYGKNREYIEAYTATVEDFLKGNKRNSTAEIAIDEGRKDKALKALLNRAMSLVEDNDALDPDTLKTLTEIFKKTGILKEEVEVQEKPRRYLPSTCADCRYKQFIDEQVRLGNIVEENE